MEKLRWIVVVTAAFVIAPLGCDKEKSAGGDEKGSSDTEAKSDKGPTKAASGDGEAKPTADKAEATTDGAEASAALSSGYAVFPGKSEILFGINFTQLRGTKMWPQFLQGFNRGAKDMVVDMKACGIDLTGTVSRVLFGGNTADESEAVGVIQGITRDQFAACTAKLVKDNPKKFKFEDKGGVTQYKTGDGNGWISFLGDSTMLFAPGERDRAWVDERRSGKNGLASNKEFMALLGQVDTRASMFFVLVPKDGSDMAQSMGQIPTKPLHAFGSVKADTGLVVDFGLGFDTADNANATLGMVRMFLGQLEGNKAIPAQARSLIPLAKKLQMKVEGTKLLFNLALSAAELEALDKLAQGMGVGR